ncbi:MJ0042 family finger-like domain-containing protein [Alcaligenes sp. HPC1271]|nr:MJ0042 family finger-like domain-containing protein [Alcaligenes sp. HPC1271]
MYVYRVQIVSQIPMLRPVFESACQTLSCKVPYERRLDQIRVQASALHKAPNQPDSPPWALRCATSLNGPRSGLRWYWI